MNAVILLAPNLGDFFFTNDQVALARKLLTTEAYRTGALVSTTLEGEECAEEMFDLTNNPSRSQERAIQYGEHRSISVGDIVICGNDFMLCMATGWEKL